MEKQPWKITEDKYLEEKNVYYETLFTLANGYMGARGLHEEGFSGDPQETYPGTYIAGVYDAFEENWVELVNVPDFLATKIYIDNHVMDLRLGKVANYTRVLDMRQGTLTRTFDWTFNEHTTRFEFQRFMSMDDKHVAAMRIRVTPMDHSFPVTIQTQIDGEVFNRRQRDWPHLNEIIPNYHLDPNGSGIEKGDIAWLHTLSKKSEIDICTCAGINVVGDGNVESKRSTMLMTQTVRFDSRQGQTIGLDKIVSVYTSRDESSKTLRQSAIDACEKNISEGYDSLLEKHISVWAKRWDDADIIIDGDPGVQQGMRFNIFHLIQANSSDDPFVNIPAKLLSHTRYKGCCFWDTEIFMFPFFVYTNPEAARNLLMYRYNLLPAARKIAAKDHWCSGARYPFMSAHDGSNQCSSWEYGDCEVHITGDIAFAIGQYVKTTGDMEFLGRYGAEILIETARYWKDRVAWNERLGKYALLSVKGPDEYCSVTNNNMYTNYLACFNLELAEKAVDLIVADYPDVLDDLKNRIEFTQEEVSHWRDVREKMYFNWDGDILIQDDTFLDQPEEDLSKYKDRTRPLCEIMPIERLMRVRLLRQADAVLLMYLLSDKFTAEQKQATYDFYEPITTHDSSLSYNTYGIMAAELGDTEKALDYLRKTARLDLDNELNTAKHGIHGASTGGTWQTLVNGFGGVRLIDGKLSISTSIPKQWQRIVFKVQYKGSTIKVEITHESTELELMSGPAVEVTLNQKMVTVK